MLKHHARQVVLLLGTMCIAFLCTSSAFGQVAYDSSGCTTNATANSVFNIKAKWTDGDGMWPLYLPFTETESGIQPDPGDTIQEYHAQKATQSAPAEHDASEVGHRLGIILGTGWAGDPTDLLNLVSPYPAETYPSAPVVANRTYEEWPSNIPTIVPDPTNTTGYQKQIFVPRHILKYIDTVVDGETVTDTETTIDVPPVIVTLLVPATTPSVNFGSADLFPYSNVLVADATGAFCTQSVRTRENGAAWGEATVSSVSEPTWVSAFAGGNAAYMVTVTVLGPNLTESDEGSPDVMYPGAERAYIEYDVFGAANIDTSQVSVNKAPLPAASTVYSVPALNSLDGSVKAKVNTGIVDLDPNRTDPNDADSRNSEKPGINSPLLGVYQSSSASSDDDNLFVPGNYEDAGNYGQITIPEAKLPEGGIDDWTDLYVKVSTWAIDGVWTKQSENSDTTYPRRIDYSRKLEWTSGVITGTWNGPGTGRPASPAAADAYTVTPDVVPSSLFMQAVTGMYLPQIMSGTVDDTTHVTPSDASKIGIVLGVFALSSQTASIVDQMHVNPSISDPSKMSFVSAVYGVDSMSGTPVDSSHVTPASSSDIQRVLSVKVPGDDTEYYDAAAYPWTPGDTTITLSDEVILPAGTAKVTVTYETTNLYDSEDPSLAYDYDESNPLSRYVTLTTPLPSTATGARIVYGIGTGLDGFNYYDPNNTSTTFRPNDTQITLRQSLSSDVTDVRILYGTDSTLETRGAVGVASDGTTPDLSKVVPPNIWRIGRVKGVYAILEQVGVATMSSSVVTATDASRIRKVLGVYAQGEMTATQVDDTHIAPEAPLTIRTVSGVYATLNQSGAAGSADTDGKIRTVVPSDAAIIGKVYGVWDNEEMTGTNYFDPDNPETVFSNGNSTIRLSTPLPSGVGTLTINYETIDLGPSFNQGDSEISLSTAIPQSVPAIDSVPIRVTYVANFNYYNVNNPVETYTAGSSRVALNTALPSGTVEVVILYAEDWNRYAPVGTTPSYLPGQDYITLSSTAPLPSDAQGGVVEYTPHLFKTTYDPSVYDPSDSSTYSYRPFIPGDKIIRLNRISSGQPIWSKYTDSGALKLCIAYQSSLQVEHGDYSQGGTITLPVPLPDSTTGYHVKYRPLSSVTGPTCSEPPKEGLTVRATYTLGRPRLARITRLSFYEPDPLPDPVPITDSTGKFQYCSPPGVTSISATYRRQGPDQDSTGHLWVGLGGSANGRKSYNGYIPLYIDATDGTDPKAGVTFRCAVSAGLNLSNINQQPSCNLDENAWSNTNRLIFDPRGNPMWYAPALKAYSDGSPVTVTNIELSGHGYYEAWKSGSATESITIHDSRVMPSGGMIDHGGVSYVSKDVLNDPILRYGRDYLVCSPTPGAPDPLVLQPIDDAAPTADDGPSSSQFVFRCQYFNQDGLPPLSWLHSWGDSWSNYSEVPKRVSGVVLYLDATGTGDYQPHFMGPEDPNTTGSGATYIYRVIPRHDMGLVGDPGRYPWVDYENNYVALSCGTYHYFFGCSDDSLEFDFDKNYIERELAFDYQPDYTEWGSDDWYSSALDPSLARNVTGLSEINRTANRRYSFDNVTPYDSTIHVDRAELVPGLFDHWYQLPSSSHPKVTCELRVPSYDDLNVAYDDAKYGYGRFLGTVDPFYRAVNPLVKLGSDPDVDDPTFQGFQMLAETCGSTTKTDNVFRVLYKQVSNVKPISIKVYINNASYKKRDPSGATDSTYTYTGYTMSPSADQTTLDYRTGVWYEYTTKLAAGPHTYYFEANDGTQVARFPIRPDKYVYDTDGTDGYEDWWVPTSSLITERGTDTYFDNDYFPGPYINSPCVLSDAAVTPGTGKQGDTFTYRVKYSDADGQRPYSAYVYIETDSAGDVRRVAMTPETPFTNPAADHSQDYINGVYYVLDTGTLEDLVLENGVRRFYFEFTDDWGPYYDLNDTVQGELTRYPQGTGNWVTGPVISGNNAPTLYGGSATSQDGTANAATLWTFKVDYRDLDNDAPTLAKVYIGLLQPDGRTVVWDEGHTLVQSNTSDKVYSDGAEFYFQTRLGAADEASLNESKQYFYAFEAYDGVNWATYLSSSDDETRSNSAGCMVLDDLTRADSDHYVIRPRIAQQATVTSTTQVTPTDTTDILRVWGVYLTEDLDNASSATQAVNYYEPGDDPPLYAGGAITLTTALPSGLSKVWLQYEAQSPIVGPLPIDLPAPSGVIPDALLYENYSSNRTAILIDDQKNGWINTDPDYPNDRGIVRMRGVATYEGEASVKYVTPDSPTDIASVEGVYLDAEMTGENYYDTSLLEPPMTRTGTVDTTDTTRKTVIPDDPDAIAYVTGVYNPADTTGTNYFMGTGYSGTVTWQEALVVGGNTVWPKNPNDIVTVKGVYLSSSSSGTNYYRSDGLAVQKAYVYEYLAQGSSDVAQVLGIYLTRSDSGTNYYNSSVAATAQYQYRVMSSLPTGTSQVEIYYLDGGGTEKWMSSYVYVASVQPNDPKPIASVKGAYLSVQYDASGKPSGVGTNYASSSSYANGGIAVTISPISVGSLSSDRSLYLIYETMPRGFGPYNEYLGVSKDLSSTSVSTVYIAYYPRGTVQQVKTKKYITLTSAMPTGVSQVNIECIAKAFNCGDSVIPLTKSLPEGTSTVWIKYSDIRFTHQLRGTAQQPYTETYWITGTSHYSPDGWDAGSSEDLWTVASVVDPLTVAPAEGSSINAVLGVYLTQDTSGADYYSGTSEEFVEGDSVIKLVTSLPSGVSQVYVNYSPRNVHIKNNELDETGLLSDVTSGVIGVWLNSSRDGTNYFDPRFGARHEDDVKHLRLTTAAPDGTGYLWGTYYQKGDYHIDRWNRDVYFVSGKEKDASASIQASYFFGTKMPQVLVANTAPTLSDGGVNKIRGSRSDQYVFSVTYRDLDGPNGQAPTYIRVYVDGKAYDMTSTTQGGTPAYREGAVYEASPTEGLSGGSHKFYFEASDGAAVALYDWYDENNETRPTTGDTVVAIDGPWVNDPPELSDGTVTPNPTEGIDPWDSVDYTVVYTDDDGDAPYFYDATLDGNDVDSDNNGILDGQEWSGSPKLWVDSSTDKIVTGTVASLEDDALEPGKKRIIVAAGSPGWTVDQFAGKLLQISNGALSGRVYLIQSNTESSLTLSTDDLAADGVKTSADTTASTFRINGLLMSKADATAQDFTAGVKYTLTVPKLAVGTHKFHFTARSRETKPQWLLEKLTAAEGVPYSVQVRVPTSGDSTGPLVVSTPPDDNVAPVLTDTADTSLYVGPVSHAATATSLTQVDVTDLTTIREVRGVFLNANDFELDSLTDDSTKNYYNPGTATTPFAQGDTAIVLTTTLSASPSASMVQFGKVDVASLATVTPDVAGVIDTVEGVYLTSDLTLAGTNYFIGTDGVTTGTFDASAGTIALGQTVPSGTKSVFVSCTVKSGATWTSTPAVPVYVKYYSTTTKSSSVPILQASDLATFRITYQDSNDDVPGYHDGVQGYVKVVFNDLSTSKALQILNQGTTPDYSSGVAMTTVPINLPEGTHKYHFEASDGYVTTRFPTGTTSDATANDYSFTVNYKPVLSSGNVDPTSGQVATSFTFTTTYTDKDGPGATTPQVYVRISRVDGTGSSLRLAMSQKTTSPNYTTGVGYEKVIIPDQITPTLESGEYKVVFEATDGDDQDAAPHPADTETPLTFSIREANTAPVLSDLSVTPTAGKLNSTFVYKVTYKDADGDAPVGKVVNVGQRDELTLTIDKGASTELVVALSKASSAPTSPTADDYRNGIVYQNSVAISGKKLGAGDHTYEVSASDGTASATPISASGPVMLIPYFENFKAVSATATNTSTASAVTTADVGDEVVFVADMKFPNNPAPVLPPSEVSNITIVVTKPDGTTVSLTGGYTSYSEEYETQDGSQVRVGWTAKVTASYPTGVDSSLVTGESMTLDSSGDWTATIAWPGNTSWEEAENTGDDVAMSVSGPMRTVAVVDPSAPDTSTALVDMITPPKIVGSSDIGLVFGYELALEMQIVRWDPASKVYRQYGTSSAFPAIYPGEAIWIKPKSTYPAEAITQEMVDSGQVALGNPEEGVNELLKYRLLKPFVKDYEKDSTGADAPCVISLQSGWNQFGNIFFNWKKDSSGDPVSPREDVGIPISELSVTHLGVTKSLADAAAAGWIRDYAWRYDAVGKNYVMVHATASGAERTIKAWAGYWIRAIYDDLELTVSPTTTYNGE